MCYHHTGYLETPFIPKVGEVTIFCFKQQLLCLLNDPFLFGNIDNIYVTKSNLFTVESKKIIMKALQEMVKKNKNLPDMESNNTYDTFTLEFLHEQPTHKPKGSARMPFLGYIAYLWLVSVLPNWEWIWICVNVDVNMNVKIWTSWYQLLWKIHLCDFGYH